MVARSIAILFCVLLGAVVSASATSQPPMIGTAGHGADTRGARTETGIASIYAYAGDKTSGGPKTANGEKVVANAMSAAHKTIAFGTRVRVTNLRNGLSAVVRINNRGPFIKGRIIDLTPGAAQAIGFTAKKEGLAPVRLTVLAD